MNLGRGQLLLHYQLVEKVGEGGMGVVYRAMDTKLRREVAIKVLPDDFAQDSERLARFEREAHALASLNHPGIAAIHGIEESNGVRFLVLEWVPGETLAERLERGPLPIVEALHTACQIAEALEEAHENGIIHRDVKPANIKLTPDGRVKVLDFGLARPSVVNAGVTQLSNSPTATVQATRPGMILGTAAYMSPEQARGLMVDRRADIWAFGCCLYEALTGRRAFQGQTVTDLFAEIVKSDPDWDSLPEGTPRRIRVLLWRCLQKDAKRRLRDIGEARFELSRSDSDLPMIPPGLASALPPGGVGRWVLAIASLVAFVLGGVSVGFVVWSAGRNSTSKVGVPPMKLVKRFEVDIGRATPLPMSNVAADLAISPDGKWIAYVADVEGARGLYLRDLAKKESVFVPGTENAWKPFFSPDGRSVGFLLPDGLPKHSGRLVKISVDGGPLVELCSAFPPLGGTWLEDGTIVFTGQDEGLDLTRSPFLSQLFRVSENGGTPQRLTNPDATGRNEISHTLPKAARGQDFFLFTVLDSLARRNAALYDLKTGEHEVLLQDAVGAQYVASGYIAFMRNNALWAATFDPETRALGTPVVVQQGIQGNSERMVGPFAVSDEGSLVYLPSVSMEEPRRTLVWVDHEGREETIAVPPGVYWWPRVSPDGTRVALSILPPQKENEDIWIHQFSRVHSMIRFTFDETRDSNSLWSLDGRYLYFTSYRPGATELLRRRADGIGEAEKLLVGPEPQYAAGCTPDGTTLLFGRPAAGGTWDIMELRLIARPGEASSSANVRPLLDSGFNEGGVRLSPDGRWLAYNTDETQPTQVFVRPYPNVEGGRWQVSTDGGVNPSWSADGKEIYYRNGPKMMAVSVETGQTFRPGKARELFEGDYYFAPDLSVQYDLEYPGRRRFLMMKSLPDTRTTKLDYVDHWLEELRQLVPESSRGKR